VTVSIAKMSDRIDLSSGMTRFDSFKSHHLAHVTQRRVTMTRVAYCRSRSRKFVGHTVKLRRKTPWW